MPRTQFRCKPTAADLIALALEHRVQAERSICPADQHDLDRVADIYTVLATIDQPVSAFAKVESPAEPDDRQLTNGAQ